ncbi:POU domain protein C, putative [Pediculus humanus corporis]|uniref:POU domain protein n=1 Tax=Pediculus humanus subsp. corporis TaxID=121224 RepID=E0VZ39_PEDHC|nr:POU domain protein C, putative [Pediculus humanus corporis]EEB18645.1 POU domain protein C, putative [Pediculus humanus corporis]
MGSEDSNPPSPDQYPVQREPSINGGMPSLDTKISDDSNPTINLKNNFDAKTAEMVQHLLMMNGHHDSKMAALQSLQNLQNLATGLQNLNSVSSLVAGLQGLTGLQSMSTSLQNLTVPPQNLLNTPLNLSLGSNNSNGMMGNHAGASSSSSSSSSSPSSSSILNPGQGGTQMPQLILASGQLVQGIQGAQLLIPTSQATQTILTIPVNHVTGNQMVNLALNNGQVVTTTLAQLQSLAQPHLLSASTSSPVFRQTITLLKVPYTELIIPTRLTANNSDITITPTPAPAHQMSRMTTDAENYRRERSESPLSDGCDLLDDSPNEPMISEVQSNVVDGINLDEMKDFAKAFKLRRLSLGLTQTQVGQALSVTEGPAYSQSAICRFEKLDITPKSAQKIKPVLERWMKEAEERFKSGQNHLTEFIGMEPSKKRKRRTSFTPQALELLNVHFERNTHPSGTEITALAHQLGYEREVIRIWFCNKRQALKNTVRMMSKAGG